MNSEISIATAKAAGFALLVCCVFVMRSASLWAQTATNAELESDLERGQAALKANNRPLAIEQFRAALKLDPDNVEAHANLGVMAFFHGDCRDAEEEFQSALRAAPTLTKAKALLSICEKHLGQPSAQADLESAFANLKDPKLRTQVGVELADLYYQNGDLDHTLTIIHTLVGLDPDNVDLLFFAQRVYSEMADNTLNKLALLAPASARMQQLIAERLINAGDLKDAIDHYHKALALDPRLPGMHFELAEAFLESSNDASAQAQARQELDAAVKTDGDSARLECAYGRIALLQAKTDEAYAHYKRAYDLDPHEVQAQLGLARILSDENKPQEALRYLREAVQADPLNALAHYRLARVCHSLHLMDEEQKEITLYQEIRQAKDRVAQLYRQMNRRPESQDDLPPEGQP
jgi:tetratricopeptide (TPR) repeat protein